MVASLLHMPAVGRVPQEVVEQAIGAFQRIGRFEERDHVQGGLFEPGLLRQGQHVEDVPWTSREADDVALTGLRPEACLDVRDGPERLEHLGGSHAVRDLHHLEVRPAGDGGQRRRVDLAVLTHLQRQGVEAEGLHLPAQTLDLAVGHALHVVSRERRLELADFLQQLRG